MPRPVCWLALACASLALGAGCASFGGDDLETERLLSAAGFQMRLADNDAKLKQLEKLPQRKVLPRSHGDRTFFLYADAKGCKCLFAGTQRAYDRYQRMALAHELSVRREDAAEARANAAMDLSTWGPWGPWWF